ncbi:MAG: thymidylate synthase [Candidatus Subteraquimicrobiales bacterium]|nr:thymidylate synthase [Candidatus Subteraquimicrobiales bacterium]
MYKNNEAFKTIKDAHKEILKLILDEGTEVENTLEVQNISLCFDFPLRFHGNLFENVTPIAAKHMVQMLLKPNPELPKTHYGRLHNFLVGKSDEVGEVVVSYDQIEEVIKRLKENPLSKRCVLTLWQPQDVSDEYALSWVVSQVMIRDNKLIMTNYFRGCDIFNAFPFNLLGIAYLQRDLAKELGVEIGEFVVHIGSAHIYKIHKNDIETYLAKP